MMDIPMAFLHPMRSKNTSKSLSRWFVFLMQGMRFYHDSLCQVQGLVVDAEVLCILFCSSQLNRSWSGLSK